MIGDPDNGRYEWAFQTEQHVVSFSNASYGGIAEAMRDGLNVALGGVVCARGIDVIRF